MIKYNDGTVFNTNAKAIVNTVNCTGVMGTGIALEFMLRYPEMLEDYVAKCKNNRIVTGKVDYYKNIDSVIILNFPTKWHFKYPSKLIWIEQGLQDFVKTYQKNDVTSIAFPKLGTGNGGLNWNNVKALMEKYLSNLDIDVYICLDNIQEAEGIEKIMLKELNSLSVEQLTSVVKLNAKQKVNLQKFMPYNRFWRIADTESIGMKTYSVLFKHFYKIANGASKEPNQLSLFDLK